MVKEIQRIRGIQHKSSKKKTKFKGNMNQIEMAPFDLLRGMCFYSE